MVLKAQQGHDCPELGSLHLAQFSNIILAGCVLQNVSRITPMEYDSNLGFML